jgi:NADH-quinone oxidoreductase subunit H
MSLARLGHRGQDVCDLPNLAIERWSGLAPGIGVKGRLVSLSTVPAAQTLYDVFRELPVPFWGPLGSLGAFFAAAGLHAALLIALFGILPLFYIWLERKVSARIQDRLGPTRVGGRFGWLQTLADGIKLIQKEDLAPDAADRWLFEIAPFLAVAASFTALVAIPFADGWVAAQSNCGLFLVLAILSLEVIGIILAGYSSGSKWALFGAMREAAQMVSYEIPLALSALIPVVVVGSLDFADLVAFQQGPFWNWLFFRDPFTCLSFFVFFTAATASVKRAPFDLAEAESELVAGFHTEYSGLRWSFFFLAEYASMFTVSALAVLLYFGGWSTGLNLEPISVAGSGFTVEGYLLNLIGCVVFIVKACVLVTVQMWVRWTLPRLRIDQVMTTCLKYLVPISCVLLFAAALWPLMLLKVLNRTQLFPRSTVAAVTTNEALTPEPKLNVIAIDPRQLAPTPEGEGPQ